MKFIARLSPQLLGHATLARREAQAWLLQHGITVLLPQLSWLQHANPFFYYEHGYGSLRWEPSVLLALREQGSATVHWLHVWEPDAAVGRRRGRARWRVGMTWYYVESMPEAILRDVLGHVVEYLHNNGIRFQAEFAQVPSGRRLQDKPGLLERVELFLDLAQELDFDLRFVVQSHETSVLDTWQHRVKAWHLPHNLITACARLHTADVWLDLPKAPADAARLVETLPASVSAVTFPLDSHLGIVLGNHFFPTHALLKLVEDYTKTPVSSIETRLNLVEARLREIENILEAYTLTSTSSSRLRYGLREFYHYTP